MDVHFVENSGLALIGDVFRYVCRVSGPLRAVFLFTGITVAGLVPVSFAAAQGTELSGRAKASDANKNGVIDRDEAGGPLKSNFDEMDCNRSGTLDGAEIRGFFTGEECPKQAAAPAANTS